MRVLRTTAVAIVDFSATLNQKKHAIALEHRESTTELEF